MQGEGVGSEESPVGYASHAGEAHPPIFDFLLEGELYDLACVRTRGGGYVLFAEAENV